LQPSLAWGDGVRLQWEGVTGESYILAEMVQVTFAPDPFPFARVGVAAWDHPLYVVLTHLAVRALPWLSSLWVVNLASAVFGVGAIVLLYAVVWEQTLSLPAALVAAAALAVSHTFWFHSATPEVYTLLACLLLGAVWAYLRYQRTGRRGWLALAAFIFGLAAATHLMAFIAVPILGLDWWLARRGAARTPGPEAAPKSGRRGWAAARKGLAFCGPILLAFIGGFLLYLVQFARLLRTFSIGEMLAPAFGATFFSAVTGSTAAELAASAGSFLVLLVLQFNPLGVTLGVIGLWRGAHVAPALWRVAVGGLVVYALFGILYRVADQFAFFLPAYVFFALSVGLGLRLCLARWPARRGLLLGAAALGVLAMPALYGAAPRLARAGGLTDATLGVPAIGTGVRDGLAYYVNPNKHGDHGALRFGEATLERLPPNALVLAEWYTDTDEYYILRYLTAVEGRRPDVEIAGWPTDDPFGFDSARAVQLVEASLPVRPVYLASLSEEFYAASTLAQRYCIVIEHDLYRVLPSQEDRAGCLQVEPDSSRATEVAD
jgi:hypothetical protein